MKFRNFGRTLLAMAGAVGITLGLTSCSNDHTVGYVYVTGLTTNSLNNGQISQLREDNNNGALTAVQGAVGSGGANPIRMVTASGDRFLYVLNAGTPTTNTAGQTTGYTSADIAVFSIGGYGQLSPQIQFASQGSGSIRLITSGSFLFVLDQYEPLSDGQGNALPPTSSTASASYPCEDASGNYHPVGDVTVFSIDSTTGRLVLVPNTRQEGLTYFPVGCNPVDFRVAGGFLYTMDAGSAANSFHPTSDIETIYVQQLNATSGQLTPTTNSILNVGAAGVGCGASTSPTPDITEITGDNAGAHIYLIDTAHNAISLYTVESSGALTAVSGSEPFCNSQSQALGPVQSLVDETGKFLYLINEGPTSNPTSNASADVSAYVLDGTTGYPDTTVSQYPYTGVPAGPVCIFEDPTNQYLYVAGSAANSITGRKIDPQTGTLSALNKSGTFPTVGTPSWCTSISSAF